MKRDANGYSFEDYRTENRGLLLERNGLVLENMTLKAQIEALKEFYVAEKSENGLEWKFANTLHDLPVGTKLYAVKP